MHSPTGYLRLTPDAFRTAIQPMLAGLWPKVFTALTPEQIESWSSICCKHSRDRVEEAIRHLHATLKTWPTPGHLSEALAQHKAHKAIAEAPDKIADIEAEIRAWREHWRLIAAACEASASRAGITMDELIAEAREKAPDLVRGYDTLITWAGLERQNHADRATMSLVYGYLKRLGIADAVPTPDQLKGTV